MCGIAGWAGRPWGRTTLTDGLASNALRAMCDAIRHRGPDDDGYFLGDDVALGMRRLSIIDVVGGAQPVCNEDATVHVVFNGEIYNFRDLRRELARRGHRLSSKGDTETLVHLYEDDGDRLVDALRGMFAFALWDGGRRRLLLTRDRLGIKPLYYWATPDGVAFASELRSLLACKHFRATIDRHSVGEFLALGYVPDPGAIFESVRKLPPGHRLTWDRERGVEITRYWSPPRHVNHDIDEEEAIAELRRLLADSVAHHLESDVPLGAFLSGGVDSSAVVATMTTQMHRAVRTFSIGFLEPEFNEAPYAAQVAHALGTDHTELIVSADADALVPELVRSFDEPFGDPSALPTYLVSRVARQHVTVALSGDGGDELFGGYTRYAEVLGRRELRPDLLRPLLGFVARRLPHRTPGRNRLLDLARSRLGRYASTVALALDENEGGVARPDVATSVGPLDALLDRWDANGHSDGFLDRMMRVDLQSYLPGDILTKVDRASMAASLEARVPLLDHHVVEFALSLPQRLRMREGRGKWLFRRAISDLVPSFVLERPKQGFALPIAGWFRRELRHRIDGVLRDDSPVNEFVHPPAVARIAAEHARSRRDHSFLLWRLLALDLWLRSLARGELAKPSDEDLVQVRDARPVC
jgi:asparagine synthase (glutamine-hydrolysing)